MMRKKLYALGFLICLVLLVPSFVLCEKQQAGPNGIATGRNAHDLIAQILSPDTNLETRLELFPNILDYDEYAPPESLLGPQGVAKFLDYQVAVKLFLVEAEFMMIQGKPEKREKALNLLAASYYLGQLMNQADPLTVPHLIGIAVRAIACWGLRLYALNCCETADEFRHLWETLEELNNRSLEPNFKLLSPLALFSDIKGTYKRHRSVDARFQLVRMATAAKYCFVTQGAFPRSTEGFAPLLPDGPPKDPFGTEPLRFFSDPNLFTCYSIGPDEKDDRAAISYDPTNGTTSRGDIFVKIPHERKYPFPRDGVRAASADELRRQFPNGLPRDPFADTRGRPLGISNTTPVYVYSYGPDTDESEAVKVGERYAPEVLYDPTNGTISPGDLFIATPR